MNIKRIFITGLIFLIPTLISIFIIILVFGFLDRNFAQPVGSLILTILYFITKLSLINEYAYILAPILGFAVFLIIALLTGYLTITLLGQRILRAIENYFLKKFPIINLIYPYAKQFTDIFTNKEKYRDFKFVVALEYPRKGLYCLGFITSDGIKEIKTASGRELLTVFIPSSPTPFTGYTLMVPKEEVVKLRMTVDEAIRFVVSGGILHEE
jgi:uncharacterized membrane protein